MIITAYRMGTLRATNVDITKQTQYMQDLIDAAYAERDRTANELKRLEKVLEQEIAYSEGLADRLEEIEMEKDDKVSI